MNVRRCTLKNAKGGSYTYLQLVHNQREKQTGKTKTHVILNLGREDKLEPSYVEAIIENLAPLIEKAPKSSPANFTFHASKELVYFVKPKSPKKSCKFPHQAMGSFTWSFCRMSACFMR